MWLTFCSGNGLSAWATHTWIWLGSNKGKTTRSGVQSKS